MTVPPRSLASRSPLPPEGASLARERPFAAADAAPPRSHAARSPLPPTSDEGADLARGGPALRPDVPPRSLASSDGATVIELFERGHRLPLAQRLTGWPQRIGRAVDADCVLTDPAVAPLHLALLASEADGIEAEVLDTVNGVWLGRKHLAAGEHFVWPPGQRLRLGNTQLAYRRAQDPLAPEQPSSPTPVRQLRAGFITVLCLLVLLLITSWGEWQASTDPSRLHRELPVYLLGALAGVGVWATVWALLTRLLTGHFAFWRHVRIAALGLIALMLVQVLADALGFMFSLPWLPRFGDAYLWLILAAAVWAHLCAATSVPRRTLAVVIGSLAVLTLATSLTLQWQSSKRLGTGAFMSSLLPPTWRLAPTQDIDGFVNGVDSVLPRLTRRLKDKPGEDSAE